MKWLTILVIAIAIVASIVAALLYAAGGSAAQIPVEAAGLNQPA